MIDGERETTLAAGALVTIERSIFYGDTIGV